MAKIEYLFKTSAFQMAPANEPFWLTSGLLAPYYINTHFLCGGKERAVEILNFIDNGFKKKDSFFSELTDKFEACYKQDSIYQEIINELTSKSSQVIKDYGISRISGGARRDWFFSIMVAKKLGMPHIFLSKEKEAFEENGSSVQNLRDENIINIADLLTLGSSYVKAWAPAIKDLGGKLLASANIVDRCQGGEANLIAEGVGVNISLIKIDIDFFQKAKESNFIDSNQFELINDYLKDPFACMRNWLGENPEFIENALNSEDLKTKKRAETLISENLYKLA